MIENKEIAFKGKTRTLYIGDVIGAQTILEKSYITQRKDGKTCSRIKVRCKCGKIRDISVYNIRIGTYGCTSCANKLQGHEYENISGQLFSQMLSGANRRNLEVSITSEYLNNLWLKQNKKCALTGLDLTIGFGRNAKSTASIDRIDSSKGYVEGNIQFLHKDINKMKMDFDQNYFINICKLISLKNG